MRRTRSRSIAAFLLTIFSALAVTAVVLPGCGDDGGSDSNLIDR